MKTLIINKYKFIHFLLGNYLLILTMHINILRSNTVQTKQFTYNYFVVSFITSAKIHYQPNYNK